MLSVEYRKECSENGQKLGETKSAIQKYIRRGEEEKALKIGREMSSYWLLQEGMRVKTNLMNRLKIIYMEDVGIGNYEIWEWMVEKMGEMKEAKKREEVEKILEEVIRVLCRSRKTRLCSFMKMIGEVNEIEGVMTEEEKRELDEATSEEALVSGMRKGMESKRAVSGGYLVKMYNLCLCDGGAKKWKKIEGLLGEYVSMKCSVAWKDLRKNKEGILLYMLPLVYYLYGSEEKQLVRKEDLVGRLPEKGWEGELDEYVYDKHVMGGNGGKTEAYFALESSLVRNETYRYPLILKKIYQWIKCEKKGEIADYCKEEIVVAPVAAPAVHRKMKFIVKPPWPTVFPERETDYEFICRVQLTCSETKTDTVYARYAGRVWFVKGPYANKSQVEEYISLQEEKRLLGLPVFRTVCVMMYPDRWDKVPVGVRNKLEKGKKYWYEWSECIVREEEMEREKRRGKKWLETEVIKNKWRVEVYKLSGKEKEDYMKTIKWRKERNVGDMGDRNFMRVGGRVYSVDEAIKRGGEVSLKNDLKKRKYEYVKSELKKMGYEI